jgi:hypothetical protein
MAALQLASFLLGLLTGVGLMLAALTALYLLGRWID